MTWKATVVVSMKDWIRKRKSADQYVADKEKKFEQTLEVALHETARDLRYQAVKPETRIKSAWTIGEE
jgi:hypothetical protein